MGRSDQRPDAAEPALGGDPNALLRRGPSPSLVDFGAARLESLCRAADFGESTARVVDVFRTLLMPWGDIPAVGGSTWVSDISDDNTPIELSAAIANGRVEVRVLLEAQASEPTLAAHRAAGLALTARLESELGADLSRFSVVRDLFLPEDMAGPFALWHSVVFDRHGTPSFKAYFNPQARGRGAAQALVEEALQRLGMTTAWASLCRTARRGPHLDELKYFALDLSADPQSRVKVYVRHHDATPEDLEAAASVAQDYVPGEVAEFVRAMGGDRERLASRATFTCSAFTGPQSRPSATTVYVPVCAYAPDDRAVQQRVHEYLDEHGMDPAPYDALIEGYAARPLEAGVGMQSWVAFRRMRVPRLTVYLATEAGKVHPRGTIPAATGDRHAFASAEAVLRCAAEYDLAQHPFVAHLRREPDAEGVRELARWLEAFLDEIEPLRPATDDGLQGAAVLMAGQLGAEQIAGALARLGVIPPTGGTPATRLARAAGSDAGPFDRARAIPTDSRAISAVRLGAMGLHAGLWRSLDELYVERFGGGR